MVQISHPKIFERSHRLDLGSPNFGKFCCRPGRDGILYMGSSQRPAGLLDFVAMILEGIHPGWVKKTLGKYMLSRWYQTFYGFRFPQDGAATMAMDNGIFIHTWYPKHPLFNGCFS